MTGPARRIIVIVLIAMTLAATPVISLAQPAGVPQFGSAEMVKIWFHVDYPVVTGKAQRSFTFGPELRLRCQEPYDEGDGGRRPVAYLDKARLEETTPNSVTAGLLATELISGQRQLGDNHFRTFPPATEPVAGDPVVSDAPTYASFARVASINPAANRAPNRVGQLVTATLNRTGQPGEDAALARYGVTVADYNEELGHNIPRVFIDFFNRSGDVAGIAPDGVTVDYWEDRLLFWPDVMGFPLSEPYWAQVPVGGVTKWVLIQPFQRRVVTYTPDNDPAFRVEMGNIGLHYLRWRHPGGSCAE
jgi:hypothetical protein